MIKLTKADVALVIFLILSIILLNFFLTKNEITSNSKYAIVKVDGKEEERVKLGDSLDKKKINIDTDHGEIEIEFFKDKVRVIDSDCPDKLCIKQGSISKIGEIIVCLPLRVTVEIEGSNNIDEDVINY